MRIDGESSTDRESRLTGRDITINKAQLKRAAMDSIAFSHVQLIASDTAEAGSTAFSIFATAHQAKTGDLIEITSGANAKMILSVEDALTDEINLSQALSSAITPGTTFNILRFSFPRLTPTGGLTVTSPVTPADYDFIDLVYTGSDLTSVVYKTGGSGGSTVLTLTLTYSGGRVETVTYS